MERKVKWHIIAVAVWRVVVATGLLAGVTLGGLSLERVGACLAGELERSAWLSKLSAELVACPYRQYNWAKSPHALSGVVTEP